jgi:hypothetical protein
MWDGQTSWLETTVQGPGFFGFYYNAEGSDSDVASFTVDGIERDKLMSPSSVAYRYAQVEVGPGTHIFRWSFTRNSADNTRYHALSVDMVTWTYIGGPSRKAGADTESSGLTFATGGDLPWFGTTFYTVDGVDAVRSGQHWRNGQSSWLETTVQGPGVFGFSYNAGGSDSDVATFTIDGIEPFKLMSPSSVFYRYAQVEVGPGTHTIRWSFTRSSADNAGSHWFMVDMVTWTSSMPAPEFPSAFLPAAMIIGFLGAVLLIQRTREH